MSHDGLMLSQSREEVVDVGHTAKACDLCGGGHFELICRRDRRGRPLDTVSCRDCGLVVHRDVPGEEQLAGYYAAEYRAEYHHEIRPSPRRVLRAWWNAERLLRTLQPHLCGQERVFEVGAGIGLNVKAFEMAGFRAAGIEPSEGFQWFAREKLAANVACGRLLDLLPVAQFDLVLLSHVIEHLRSPSEALGIIHRLLHPRGRLYVACPNLAGPFAVGHRAFHVAHIYNFTPWTLQALAEKCGFRIERWLSSEHCPELQALLVRADSPRLHVVPNGHARTMQGWQRYNLLSYNLRAGYLWSRLNKIIGYLEERLSAERLVQDLCRRCTAAPPSKLQPLLRHRRGLSEAA